MRRSQRMCPQSLASFVLVVLMFLPGMSKAASYDCHSTKLSSVEKNVCARPVLSVLDERLDSAYKAARALDKSVELGQREWMTTSRNRCADSDCLFDAYTSRLAALRSRTHGCPVSEDGLLGSWINQDGDGEVFESLAFEHDKAGHNSFESWLHQAPFAAGVWEFKDCVVHVTTGGAGQLDFSLTILGYENGRLDVASDMAERPLKFKRAGKR